MAITAAMVKDLREKTGAGMMDCKKALTETDGNEDAAIAWLREKGLAKAAKRAGRAASEGFFGSYISDDYTTGVLAELKCETDFVSKSDKFQEFAQKVADVVGAKGGSAGVEIVDPESLNDETISLEGKDVTIGDAMKELLVVLGENIQLGRIVRIKAESGLGYMGSYIHSNGKIGVLVELVAPSEEAKSNDDFQILGKDLAMQVAAIAPMACKPVEVPAEMLEKEKEIYKAQAMEEGKPDHIAEKIVEGRVKKFYKEVCLLEQPFIKDDKLAVNQRVAEVAKTVGGDIEVVRFVRLALGEDAEEEE